MNKSKKRRPDYLELYPDVAISDEVLKFLKRSDRKMEYLEYDIKRSRCLRGRDGRRVRDADGQTIALPELEVSLDKLIDEDWDFPANEPSPEEKVIAGMEIDELYRCLDLLNDDERALFDALFFSNGGEGMSERDYEKQYGVPRKTVAYRRAKIIAKLKMSFQV